MIPPSRVLRRSAVISTFVGIALFLGSYMRDIAFDTEHSTRIAFKIAPNVAGVHCDADTVVETRTVRMEATTTVKVPVTEETALDFERGQPPKKENEHPLGQHIYRSDGLVEVNPDGPHPIFELTKKAEIAWKAKLNSASKTLQDAVLEYHRRYNRQPPLGFDDWYVVCSLFFVFFSGEPA